MNKLLLGVLCASLFAGFSAQAASRVNVNATAIPNDKPEVKSCRFRDTAWDETADLAPIAGQCRVCVYFPATATDPATTTCFENDDVGGGAQGSAVCQQECLDKCKLNQQAGVETPCPALDTIYPVQSQMHIEGAIGFD